MQGDGSPVNMSDAQKMHLMESLKSFYIIKQFQLGHFTIVKKPREIIKLRKSGTMPMDAAQSKDSPLSYRKVVILDMDETLIHACSVSEIQQYE